MKLNFPGHLPPQLPINRIAISIQDACAETLEKLACVLILEARHRWFQRLNDL